MKYNSVSARPRRLKMIFLRGLTCVSVFEGICCIPLFWDDIVFVLWYIYEIGTFASIPTPSDLVCGTWRPLGHTHDPRTSGTVTLAHICEYEGSGAWGYMLGLMSTLISTFILFQPTDLRFTPAGGQTSWKRSRQRFKGSPSESALIKDVELWRLHRPSTGIAGLDTGFLGSVQDLNWWKDQIFNPECPLKRSRSSWSSSVHAVTVTSFHWWTTLSVSKKTEKFASIGCFS